MKIENVSNMSFQRKPSSAEMKVYTKSLNQGLALLNKQVDVIIHNSAAPSVPRENTGIGSLFSRTTLEKLVPFLKQHSITGIQQEPISMRKIGDNSPYSPESSAKNILMMPLEKLASDEYNNLLSKETFNRIVRNHPSGNKTDYKYVNEQYEIALREVYENFKEGNFLKEDFEDYKNEKKEYLEKAAIYRILSKHYKTDWSNWHGIDKNLYAPKDRLQTAEAQRRIEEIRQDKKDDIDYYIFCQMLMDRENKAANNVFIENGIKLIGDSPVASPAADEWINQNLLMEGKALGCPPDYFSPEGQRWGFRYFKPEKIFNQDGSLGEAGQILKKKYEDYFSSFQGGIRIDHFIGLVDPFIYTTSEKILPHNSGRIYSQPGEYKKTEDEYKNIVTKIVIPAAEKYGVKISDIICEDLGDANYPTQRVMQDLNLSGIAVTEFDYRGVETPAKNVIMLGCHDNKSFLEYVKDLFDNKNDNFNHFLHKTGLLGHDISPSDSTHEERIEIIESLRKDKLKYIAASFAELFVSPARRVQIFFSDFWGIPETYNRPGTTSGNWALRIGENFEDDYYNAVANGTAPNLAKSIAIALRQRGLDKNNKTLMQNLDVSAKILDEKV